MLVKQLPYKQAAKNTVTDSEQQKSVSMCSLKKYCEKAVQNTVKLLLLKKPCQNAR